MSYEHICDEVRKAKKPHRCVWCGDEIKPGEKYHDRAYKFEGYFRSDKMHPECLEACGKSDDIGDGFEAYQQIRGKTLEESVDINDQEFEHWSGKAEGSGK